jgi:hypothetical protein
MASTETFIGFTAFTLPDETVSLLKIRLKPTSPSNEEDRPYEKGEEPNTNKHAHAVLLCYRWKVLEVASNLLRLASTVKVERGR